MFDDFSFDSAIDDVTQKAKNVWDTGYMDVKKNEAIKHPAHPDLSRFMQALNAEDMSRSNLFIVRFTDFFNVNVQDGIIDLKQPINPKNDDSSPTDGYNFRKVAEMGLNAATNTGIGKKIMGAYNPKLVNMIPGGKMITGYINEGFDANKDISMLVKSVTTSGSQVDFKKNLEHRHPFNIPVNHNIDPLHLVFYLRTNHQERIVFERWKDMIVDHHRNAFGLFDSYTRKIDVFPLDRNGVPQSIIQYDKCYPTRIGEIAFDSAAKGAIATLDVEFSFSTYKTSSFQGQSPFFDQVASGITNIKANPMF